MLAFCLEKINSLTAAGLRVTEESCWNSAGREVGRRLVRHMPALMLFFSYLSRSVTRGLCETDNAFFPIYLKGLNPVLTLHSVSLIASYTQRVWLGRCLFFHSVHHPVFSWRHVQPGCSFFGCPTGELHQ